MMKRTLNHFDISGARNAYKEGKNITEFLRLSNNCESNTPEIIELAYDLQAGSYIDRTINNPKDAAAYTTELASIIDKHIKETDSMLDIGTGELTTISHLICSLQKKPKKVFAFDISWSRVYKGTAYAKNLMGEQYNILEPFVADIKEIPLLNKSINITTSSHALEPNGAILKELLTELFRVTIDKLILFEPCFEINSKEGKERMDKLGYIKNIDGSIEELGGTIVDKILMKNLHNPLNPTVCFIVKPPEMKKNYTNTIENNNCIFSVPGTNIPAKDFGDYYFSDQTGLCYPKLKSIPILKSNAAILASSLCE